MHYVSTLGRKRDNSGWLLTVQRTSGGWAAPLRTYDHPTLHRAFADWFAIDNACREAARKGEGDHTAALHVAGPLRCMPCVECEGGVMGYGAVYREHARTNFAGDPADAGSGPSSAYAGHLWVCRRCGAFADESDLANLYRVNVEGRESY